MPTTRRSVLLGAPLAAALLPAAARAQEEEWPARSVSLVVQFGAGGSNDQVARLFAQSLGNRLNRTFIVNNRPGGQGGIAVDYVRRAAPDGYTILVGSYGAMAVGPAAVEGVTFDPLKDLLPVCTLGAFPLVLIVRQDSPLRTVQDLVAAMRATPERNTAAGSSAVFQMAAALFDQRVGTRTTYVAYRSGSESTQAVASGDVLYAFVDSAAVVGPVDAKLVRPLAVSSPARVPQWPEAPIMAEAGVPGLEVVLWNGLFLPLGTPEAVVRKLAGAVAAAAAEPDLRNRLRQITVTPMGDPPEAFRAMIARDLALWRDVARRGGIRLER